MTDDLVVTVSLPAVVEERSAPTGEPGRDRAPVESEAGDQAATELADTGVPAIQLLVVAMLLMLGAAITCRTSQVLR